MDFKRLSSGPSTGISLAFRDICYSAKVSTGLLTSERKEILVGANGVVMPGQCCAILGSSGSVASFC